MSRWWRAYDEALHDPKLIALPNNLFRNWFNLMCISSKNGGYLPPISIVATELRVSKLKAELIVSALLAAKLLDDCNGLIEPHNWGGRQYQSDRDPTAPQRSKRYRDKHRVTRDETGASRTSHAVQNTETDNRDRVDKAKKLYLLPADWQPNGSGFKAAEAQGWSFEKTNQEIQRFKDHAQANNRRQADWNAAWRNWVTSPYQQKANGHGKRPGVMEALDYAIDRAGGDTIEGDPAMRDITPRRS